MKLKSVVIENFRAIKEMQLLPDRQMTVLHGANAHGKTSVLSAIAVGLAAIPRLLPDVAGIGFEKKDRGSGQGRTMVSITTFDNVSWERTSGGLKNSEASNWPVDEQMLAPKNPLKDLKQWLEKNALKGWGAPVDLPIMAFYDTERAVAHLTKMRGWPKGATRFGALSGALSARTNFRELFEWFYMKENEELREQRERHDLEFRLKELSAVRKAISSMIEGVTNPHVELKPLRFVVSEKLDQGTANNRNLDQLSGGYKAVLALSADLAWRMAQGNPHRENPLESEAVVLIDEIELHLHPAWQQRVLSDLTRTFPNAQFIVTTHSPQILTTVLPHQIVELKREDDQVTARQIADATYGVKAGDVLSNVMGVDERPIENEFVKLLERYSKLVGNGRGESEAAVALRSELDRLSPRDPALDRVDIELRRQQLLKEMGKSN